MTQDPAESAARLYAQGVALARRNLWSEAEATFLQAAHLAPKASLNWLSVAIACCQQERYEQAAVAVHWALRAIPIRETAESQLGGQRFEASDWPGTEEAFLRLVEKGPIETPTHLFLAIALLRQGKIKEALTHLMSAYRLEIEDA